MSERMVMHQGRFVPAKSLEWNQLPDPEKIAYLYSWNDVLEQAVRDMVAQIATLETRLRKVEASGPDGPA
jgi:hypothetical protein